MQNLRDKLLKAGMVTQEAAQKAESEAQRPKPRAEARGHEARPRPERERHDRPPRRDRPEPRDRRPAAREAPIPKLPPLPGSKEFQRIESMKQRALDKQLRELVFAHQVPPESGGHTFYFVTRKGRLRRLEMSQAQAKLLEEGQLAVVERQDPDKIEHALVPPAIATQMHQLFPKSVRFFNRPEQPVGFLSEDDLKTRQQAEADGTARDEPEEGASASPSEPAEPAAESAGDTWIAVKRAPAPVTE